MVDACVMCRKRDKQKKERVCKTKQRFPLFTDLLDIECSMVLASIREEIRARVYGKKSGVFL